MYAQEGLDDYLRTTTGCFDLADVGQLELVVDTREMVVSSLGQKLPRHTTTQLLPEHSFFRLAPGGPGGPRDLRGYLPRPSPPCLPDWPGPCSECHHGSCLYSRRITSNGTPTGQHQTLRNPTEAMTLPEPIGDCGGPLGNGSRKGAIPAPTPPPFPHPHHRLDPGEVTQTHRSVSGGCKTGGEGRARGAEI